MLFKPAESSGIRGGALAFLRGNLRKGVKCESCSWHREEGISADDVASALLLLSDLETVAIDWKHVRWINALYCKSFFEMSVIELLEISFEKVLKLLQVE